MVSKAQMKSAFRKALFGVKKGYKETSRFVKTYGPPAHNYIRNVATNINDSFRVNPNVKVKTRILNPTIRIKGIPKVKDRVRVRNVDFNRLGMRY